MRAPNPAKRPASLARRAAAKEALPRLPAFFGSERLSWLLFAACCALGAALCFMPVGPGEADVWWHLKTGQWILDNRALPTRDPFTFASPPGTRWHDIQWLFQIVAAWLHALGGWNALIAYRVLGATLLAAALWRWLRALGFAPAFVFAAVATTIADSSQRFTVRPELLTFALTALHLHLYGRALHGGGRLPLAALLASQCFWANWHSSSVLGIVLAALFSATELWRQRASAPQARPAFSRRLLLGLTPAMALASMLNPHLWVAPLYALTEAKRSEVLELQPPGLGMLLGAAGVVALVSLAGWRRFPERSRLFYSAVVVLFAFQAARMLRFQPYFALAAAPFQAQGWRTIAEGLWRLRLPYRAAAAAALLAAMAAAMAVTFAADSKLLFRFGLDESGYPAGAADFVLKENLNGRLYNEFSSGGYLVWRFAPERKVFIFGETRLNGATLDRVAKSNGPAELRRIFEDYDITYALLECSKGLGARKPAMTLASLMLSSWKDWKMVYWDDTGMVFVRDLPEYKDLIARRQRHIPPDAIPYRTNPNPNVGLLERMAKDDARWPALEKELLETIGETPRHYRAALALGLMREARSEDPKKALEAYRIAERLDPKAPELLQLMARCYLSLGEAQKAALCQEKALANGADSCDAYSRLAFLQVQAGQLGAAQATAKKMARKYPGHPATAQVRQLVGM